MKRKLLLLSAALGLSSVTTLAQVTVTSNCVTRERKGADVEEWKGKLEIEYPKFSGIEDKETLRKLEETFSYWRVFEFSLEETEEDRWLDKLGYTVNYNKNGIIELKLTESGSGAYPDDHDQTIVADLSTGTRIEMTDLFQNRIGLLAEIDKKQQIEILAAKKENRESYDTDGSEFDDVSKASDEVREFSVSDLGVSFLYDYGFPHVIKALQPPGRFFFSWTELKPFLREYSSLEDIIRNAPTP